MTIQESNKLLDRQPLSKFRWSIGFFLFHRPINDIFHRVIGRAYERSIINSSQMHEICGIWNRMFNGQ